MRLRQNSVRRAGFGSWREMDIPTTSRPHFPAPCSPSVVFAVDLREILKHSLSTTAFRHRFYLRLSSIISRSFWFGSACDGRIGIYPASRFGGPVRALIGLFLTLSCSGTTIPVLAFEARAGKYVSRVLSVSADGAVLRLDGHSVG